MFLVMRVCARGWILIKLPCHYIYPSSIIKLIFTLNSIQKSTWLIMLKILGTPPLVLTMVTLLSGFYFHWLVYTLYIYLSNSSSPQEHEVDIILFPMLETKKVTCEVCAFLLSPTANAALISAAWNHVTISIRTTVHKWEMDRFTAESSQCQVSGFPTLLWRF